MWGRVRQEWRAVMALTGGAGLALAAAAVPSGRLQAALHMIVWAWAAASVAMGMVRWRPVQPTPWLLLISGLVAGAAASGVWYGVGGGASYPTLSNILQILGDALICCAALGFFVWRRRHVPSGLRTDLAVVVISLALFSVTLLGSELGSRLFEDPVAATSVVLGELLAVGAAFGARGIRAARNVSGQALLIAVVAGIVGNVLVVAGGVPVEPFRTAEAWWLGALAMLAFAGSHSSMQHLPLCLERSEDLDSERRMALVGVGLSTGPILVLVSGILQGDADWLLVAGLFAIAGLIFARLAAMFSERERALDALEQTLGTMRRQEAQMRSLLSSTADAVVLVDEQGECTWTGGNTAILQRGSLVGRRPAELLVDADGDLLFEAIARVRNQPGAIERMEVSSRHSRGTVFEIHVVAENTSSAHGGVVLWWRDVTEQAERLDEATRDPLTGLINRTVLLDGLAQALASVDRMVAVLFIDLDGFKQVNDEFGHQVGDGVLQTAAHRLQAQIRSQDLVARFGGDEFAVVCRDLDRPGAAAELGDRIHRSLIQPMTIEGQVHTVGCSVGISLRRASDPHDGGEAQLERADAAMYRAKRTGVGVVVAHATPVQSR